jgi:FkbM family methyltransferase
MPVQGIKLWRHPAKADSDRTRMISGGYEAEMTKFLLSFLKPGMHFVDIGAHIGYFTILAAKAVEPIGKVWAFEPMPSTFLLLQRNIKENGVDKVVEAFQSAVTDKVDGILLFPHHLLGRSSIVKRDGMRIQEAMHVETTSLDSFFKNRRWPRIDLIKMDIEGAEAKAIKGMNELVKRNPPVKLIVEFNLTTMEAARVTPKEFFLILQGTGFNVFRVIGCPNNLNIPSDIAWLIEHTRNAKDNVNLLCEKFLDKKG